MTARVVGVPPGSTHVRIRLVAVCVLAKLVSWPGAWAAAAAVVADAVAEGVPAPPALLAVTRNA